MDVNEYFGIDRDDWCDADMTSFRLPHALDFNPNRALRHNWLWYSHGNAPTDRPVITGYQDPNAPGVRMAEHYFLSDYAHQMLSKGYMLSPLHWGAWQVDIYDPQQAMIFKLTFV